MGVIAHETPLYMLFSRQEYWSGLSFPSPGDRPDPGIKHMSLASPAEAGRFLTNEPPGKPSHELVYNKAILLRFLSIFPHWECIYRLSIQSCPHLKSKRKQL